MANPSLTQGIEIIPHQEVTNPDTVIGTVIDVQTKFSGTLYLLHAPVQATANTNPGSFLIQLSPLGTGVEHWTTLQTLPTKAGTPADELLDAAEPAAEKVIAVTLTAGFVAGDIVYLEDKVTLANSEWHRLQEIVTDVSINLIDGLTNAKAIGDEAFGQAEMFIVQVDLLSAGRLRVVFQHEGAVAADSHIYGTITTTDSIG